ncbi:MAG: glycerol kinase GlpK [Betaproteobacteria bacterium]|nr:glycerol kinase GlpK [Betaproteobacteria bacterium]
MTAQRHILALDQGTSSSRSIIFDSQGRIISMAQLEFTQHYPQPGWVEHDAHEIWTSQLHTARQALSQAGLKASDLAAVGITNQRETTVVWDRRTGQAIAPAIVWQDRRTEPSCRALREGGYADRISALTGLVVDPYFSGTKLAWLLDRVPGARDRAERGELAFGTVDSWLLFKLTRGAVHATDVSNASRTMLFDLHRQDWSDEMLGLLKVPRQVLPTVHPSAYEFGQTAPDLLGSPVLIGGMAGDQQAALLGQGCTQAGQAKNTYGTGCFMLLHSGTRAMTSTNGLLCTAAAQTGTDTAYALEGSVFIGGAVVQWLRDGLKAIGSSAEVEALARSAPDAGGVVFVPAFTGLGAPYWKADARGAIMGLTRGTTTAHLARAALESVAFQSADLLLAMQADAQAASGGVALTELRVDGGACVNDLLMQFQADLLGMPVLRPVVHETTALGAAALAGITTGVLSGAEQVQAMWQLDRCFVPQMSRDEAQARMQAWHSVVCAVQQV